MASCQALHSLGLILQFVVDPHQFARYVHLRFAVVFRHKDRTSLKMPGYIYTRTTDAMTFRVAKRTEVPLSHFVRGRISKT